MHAYSFIFFNKNSSCDIGTFADAKSLEWQLESSIPPAENYPIPGT